MEDLFSVDAEENLVKANEVQLCQAMGGIQ